MALQDALAGERTMRWALIAASLPLLQVWGNMLLHAAFGLDWLGTREILAEPTFVAGFGYVRVGLAHYVPLLAAMMPLLALLGLIIVPGIVQLMSKLWGGQATWEQACGRSNWRATMLLNPIIKLILRSPLHGLISKSILLITYTGRKSGKQYTVPVNYVRDGTTLLTTSLRTRVWWRNLQGGTPVRVRVAGADIQGVGDAITSPQAVAAALMTYLQSAPRAARYFGVALDRAGRPKADDVARAAASRVMVRIQGA